MPLHSRVKQSLALPNLGTSTCLLLRLNRLRDRATYVGTGHMSASST
jgi:hypothetical protein